MILLKQQVISSAIIRDTKYADQIFNEGPSILLCPTIVKQKIMAGRQHYLRFKVPDTPGALGSGIDGMGKAPSDMPIFPDLDVAPAIPTPSLIAKQKKNENQREAVDLNGYCSSLLPAQLGRRRLASSSKMNVKNTAVVECLLFIMIWSNILH
ncbi:MAG: hypothetical protein IPF93_16785 [Saprospiraceae bacterium]|nr:hypothetical protein [Saprospiraceae bacterium]